jgi:hypothetical protein
MRRFVLPAALLALLVAPIDALAQVASTLEELPAYVNLDDSVVVTDIDGRRWQGQVTALSAERLVLRTKSTANRNEELMLPEGRIRRVVLRKDDSLRNGALIGWAAMVGIFVAGAVQGSEPPESVFVSMLFPGGLGAFLGAGIDAGIQSNVVVFEAGGRSSARLSIAPITGGAGLAVGW